MSKVPGTEDPLIRELADQFREYGQQASEIYGDILDEEDEGRRNELLALALLLLAAMTTFTRAWLDRDLVPVLQEADQGAKFRVGRLRPRTVFSTGIPGRLTSTATSGVLTYLLKSRNILESALRRIYRVIDLEQDFPAIAARVIAENPGASELEIAQKIKRVLKAEFQKAPVVIVGERGKSYSFPLDYYAAMVAHNGKVTAESVAVIVRAQEAGLDLVQISPNPSMHGDWCDAYRGKVFSISGTTPGFVPLSNTPNGGAPFHPWCRHTLLPFDPAGRTEAEMESLAYVDPRFVLGPTNDFNTMVRAWWASKR